MREKRILSPAELEHREQANRKLLRAQSAVADMHVMLDQKNCTRAIFAYGDARAAVDVGLVHIVAGKLRQHRRDLRRLEKEVDDAGARLTKQCRWV